jgi:hypothetical protein
MTNPPSPPHTTIVTRWLTAGRLIELIQASVADPSPSTNPIWVSDGEAHFDVNDVRTTTCHLLSNVTGYEDDNGRFFVVEFSDDTPNRRVAHDEVIEVHGIRPGSDLQ